MTIFAISYSMFLKQGEMITEANGIPGNPLIPVAAGIGGEGEIKFI